MSSSHSPRSIIIPYSRDSCCCAPARPRATAAPPPPPPPTAPGAVTAAAPTAPALGCWSSASHTPNAERCAQQPGQPGRCVCHAHQRNRRCDPLAQQSVDPRALLAPRQMARQLRRGCMLVRAYHSRLFTKCKRSLSLSPHPASTATRGQQRAPYSSPGGFHGKRTCVSLLPMLSCSTCCTVMRLAWGACEAQTQCVRVLHQRHHRPRHAARSAARKIRQCARSSAAGNGPRHQCELIRTQQQLRRRASCAC